MKISIIIPTRERANYLFCALETTLAIPDPDVEIIVSDNASADDTSAVLDAFDDPRLLRLNTQRRVSMRQNFQYALSQSSGDYVLYFGDDDAIMPRQFSALRHILEEYHPDSLSWPRMSYRWPCAGESGRFGGVLLERHKLYGAAREINLESSRRSLLAASVVWDQTWPALYHGVASRNCIDRLTPSGRDFFQAKIPDVYFTHLGIVAGLRHMYVDHAFTLNGTSQASTGGAYGRQTNQKSKDDPASRFQREAVDDPVQDTVAVGIGMAAAMFETLQTVLAVQSAEMSAADCLAWYKYILTSSRHLSLDSRNTIATNLMAHAQARGLTDGLRDVSAAVPISSNASLGFSPSRIIARWRKAIAKSRGLRFRIDGNPTAAVAAQMIDAALGNDYLAVLEGRLDCDAAWSAARRRAKLVRKRPTIEPHLATVAS